MTDGLEGIVVRPAAALVPLLEGDEFEALVADIQEHGLRFPVTFHDGQLLDGRNRVRECVRLGIQARHVDWDGGGSPTAFVVSANLRRRHLTPSQSAMAAADSLPLFADEAKERQRAHGGTAPGKKNTSGKNAGSVRSEAREVAAKAHGVSPRYVSTAASVNRPCPLCSGSRLVVLRDGLRLLIVWCAACRERGREARSMSQPRPAPRAPIDTTLLRAAFAKAAQERNLIEKQRKTEWIASSVLDLCDEADRLRADLDRVSAYALILCDLAQDAATRLRTAEATNEQLRVIVGRLTATNGGVLIPGRRAER